MQLFRSNIGVIVLTTLIVSIASFTGREVYDAWAVEPAKEVIVAAAEKQMQQDVPVYNDVAPRLRANRATLNANGYRFDDETLKAVPL